ncbi:hypothetical protein POSPLADRAFT_1074001 [Postia placenta MAD-698-R-SB12]|uniref:P-loop containing nucleoside triphosphate hydrolase protein n=1 Tax=Postia placenta MAD-698-R-SB12 TaxID=670580 RepID=A0A1X6N3X9_9APHY|nr:hypothetical protein POSPLADRAFT_1074001 [Postia placenta MAD-698-R-SB12]OSX63327.1 hypothetical protein POSPLADRAFT_1074001 [Postia placenta MAD-698-R-SB12]
MQGLSTRSHAPPWLYVAVCVTYLYASLLATLSVLAKSAVAAVANRHLCLVLLSVWAVYVYRDVLPLAIFTLSPLDASEGVILWIQLVDLTFAAVVVPLLIPRRYTPVDPDHPSLEPHPEQTASVLSRMMFTWLDKIVFKAYRVPHLPIEELPPLADYDQAHNLVQKSLQELDPFQVVKGRHVVWGLVKVFRRDLLIMALMQFLFVVARFSDPVGIRNLLWYMENGGEGAMVKPWVWISWLFLGPAACVIILSFYFFLSERVLVRIEAIMTQLVFEHALRMRVKADVSDAPMSTGNTTVAGTPDTVSLAESGSAPAREDVNNSEDDGNLSSTNTAAGETSSTQRKDKSTVSVQQSQEDSGSSIKPSEDTEYKDQNGAGKVNNLITTDLDAIAGARDIFQFVVQVPVQLVLCIWFLYDVLGWSALAGMALMVLMLPLPSTLSGKIRGVHAEKMKRTDSRVQAVTEAMSVIRMIKLFGWGSRLSKQLSAKREDELTWIRTSRLLEVANNIANIPPITMVFTYLIYTLIMKKQLTASTVFSAMNVFEMVRELLHNTFGAIPKLMRAKVSLDRMNEFLQNTELLDEFSENSTTHASELRISSPSISSDTLGFRNASFTWTKAPPSTPGSSRRNFTLHIDGDLIFERGHINLIVGPTGSGKTSLLMALLGEMHYIPAGPNSFVALPRSGGVAYAAQESWVLNDTIRNNILFGTTYDRERYDKVITQCGLTRDLELFDAGDHTEIGEKGITLSGGQKARITLARAIYSTAEILLLDDILAALDVHTAKWIVEKCLQGELVRDRTVLLVTHNVNLAGPIARHVVSLRDNGRISSQGTLSHALEHDQALAAKVAQDLEVREKAEQNIHQDQSEEDTMKANGKLVVSEEISEGHLGWPALKLYLKSMGGSRPILYCIIAVCIEFTSDLLDNLSYWYLGFWVRQYEEHPPWEVNVPFHLSVYALIMLLGFIMYFVYASIFLVGSLRASRIIHNTLITSVLGTTMRWLDKTPTGRVIARCTQDIGTIDSELSSCLDVLIILAINILIKLAAVTITAPFYIFSGIFLAVVGGYICQVYMKAQLSVKREKSNARAPVLGHFGAVFTGLVSVRAYGAQDAFRKESYARIDKYSRAARIFWVLTRWVNIRIEFFGAMFSTGLAFYLVYGGGNSSAANTGFTLNMAVGFASMILWFTRLFNDFEVAGNSLERIQQYLEIEQEPKSTENGLPPAYWPSSGNLRIEKLSARYSTDGPRVLHEISFDIKSGERVGVVGRTGSGKSSLTLALLWCIITEGQIYYDGLLTKNINLDALRSHITIIPQVPELLSGTLRQNLDPFEELDDAVLNDALRSAGLFSLQRYTDEGQITLDTQIASGGNNLSFGQKQILALARAIVRQSKLLILDEATSAIDYETDTVIQASLRKELDKGVTVLTIAHRLQTIMDADKIMVLDAGHIVEFGKPSELLQIKNGLLRALVDESGDRENLISMAMGAGTSIEVP